MSPSASSKTLALETFKDFSEEIVSIRENKDFNSSAIERLSKEKIAGVTDALLPAMQSVARIC
ncbi:hypothetical protein PMI24_05796 [Pseudomonas sp. GM25]|nr:hypothetical protein PMI24_05796 [Pseudomonas sp. GM25]